MTTTKMRRLAAVLLAGGLLAGCGGGGDDGGGVASIDEGAAADRADGDDAGDDPGGAGGGRADDSEMQDAMLEYAQCMRDEGIDMPDPEFGEGGRVTMGFGPDSGAGPESDEFQAADEACRPLIEDVRPDVELTPEEQAEMQDRLVALAECMRARGHDMPDPQVSDDGGVQIRAGAGGPGRGGPPDEQFEDDMDECHDEAGMEDGPRGTRSSEQGDG